MSGLSATRASTGGGAGGGVTAPLNMAKTMAPTAIFGGHDLLADSGRFWFTASNLSEALLVAKNQVDVTLSGSKSVGRGDVYEVSGATTKRLVCALVQDSGTEVAFVQHAGAALTGSETLTKVSGSGDASLTVSAVTYYGPLDFGTGSTYSIKATASADGGYLKQAMLYGVDPVDVTATLTATASVAVESGDSAEVGTYDDSGTEVAAAGSVTGTTYESSSAAGIDSSGGDYLEVRFTLATSGDVAYIRDIYISQGGSGTFPYVARGTEDRFAPSRVEVLSLVNVTSGGGKVEFSLLDFCGPNGVAAQLSTRVTEASNSTGTRFEMYDTRGIQQTVMIGGHLESVYDRYSHEVILDSAQSIDYRVFEGDSDSDVSILLSMNNYRVWQGTIS